MVEWSISFLLRAIRFSPFGAAALVVAAFNMLIQIVFDFIFVHKDWTKLGGWFR